MEETKSKNISNLNQREGEYKGRENKYKKRRDYRTKGGKGEGKEKGIRMERGREEEKRGRIVYQKIGREKVSTKTANKR